MQSGGYSVAVVYNFPRDDNLVRMSGGEAILLTLASQMLLYLNFIFHAMSNTKELLVCFILATETSTVALLVASPLRKQRSGYRSSHPAHSFVEK